MNIDKEIRESIVSIIFTSLLLIISTIYWFNIRPSFEKSLSIKEAIYKDIYVTGDIDIDFINDKIYQFKVVNSSDTKYYYTLSITNNYLSDMKIDYKNVMYSYRSSDGNYSEYYYMSLNGNLTYDMIPPHSELNYSIKVLKTSDYKEDITGKIVLIVDQEALAMK